MRTRVLFCALSILAVMMISIAGFAAKSPTTTKFRPKITTEQANAIVLKKFHGEIQGQTKLENEEGTWQYGVMDLSNNVLREVMVNAKTGHIDSVEVTNSSKERSEEKADAAKQKSKTHCSGDAGTKGKAGRHN